MTMTFTLPQTRLIQACKDLGYGYAKFATSVEKQGWCSPKQEATLHKMKHLGTMRKHTWNNTPTHLPDSDDGVLIDFEDGSYI
jgi:hypothetical protein